tara:strand:- start:3104 stop:3781 length:678 start_codon:yes stop_codon:yes gene_type:complete
MIEAIVFDFDGVIADSNSVKRETYFIIFSDIKNSRESIEEAIRESPKKTRYEIIESILGKLKERGLVEFENPEEEREIYVQRYGEVSERETIKAREIKGAEKALADLSQKYPLFILTSTIQGGIERVVKERRVDKYFSGVYGADRGDYNKSQILEGMAKRHGFNPEKSVFVGDGRADYECAKHHGMSFVAILNETNDFEIKEDIQYKLRDLNKLSEVVEQIESGI